ncbi:hypothetical protein ACLRDC_08450 [Gluconacetobacter sacchari]|uniref:hypothetical protein n=1 Tax=Gluconacetobacter sacchari TaxID=92759 RepID=UPI0039B6DE96
MRDFPVGPTQFSVASVGLVTYLQLLHFVTTEQDMVAAPFSVSGKGRSVFLAWRAGGRWLRCAGGSA